MCQDEYRDLSELLVEMHRMVQDFRFLWCTTSIGFETTIARRSGILIGGRWHLCSSEIGGIPSLYRGPLRGPCN